MHASASFGAVLVWAALSTVGLVLGALASAAFRPSHKKIALAMSVTAGLLLGAASLELAAEAVRIGGPLPVGLLVLLAAGIVSAANARLAARGAAHRKRCGECTPQPSEAEQPGSGVAIAIGTALDAIPEAMVLGLALHERALPVQLLLAISLANFPEALSGAAGMRSAGRSRRYILLLWSTIAIGTALTTVLGYAVFGWLGAAWAPYLQAFGCGALLSMAAETMIPEAFHNSPRYSGFVAALGFCVVLLTKPAVH